ncbi:hypothetical protein EV182_006683, partial [Spiromyces aspiralis]
PNEFRTRAQARPTESAPTNKLAVDQVTQTIDALTHDQKMQFLAQIKASHGLSKA